MKDTAPFPDSAVAIAGGIAEGRLSAESVMQECLERCQRVQESLNPFTAIYTEDAMAKSREVTARLNAGSPPRRLEGVPVAIKEFTPLKGRLTTRGSAALTGQIADENPILVDRLEQAGAIIVARTTTPEFAHSSFTRSPLFGHTRNPFDPERTCGGSSGGAAVAVATGCVPIAEGTDMGGSVRIPAALCGVAGLKPSLGRIPMDILPTVFDTISHFGPLAKSIADIRLFMEVTSGPDDLDILSQPDPAGFEQRQLDPSQLKLAVSPDLGIFDVDAEVAANFARAVDALARAGVKVEPIDLGWSAAMVDAWYDYWCVYLAAAVDDLLDENRDRMDPEFLALVDRGRAMPAVTFRRIDEVRTRQWHGFVKAMAGYDALLCPTMALPAPPLDASESDYTHLGPDGRLKGLDMTCLFNSIGQCPALSVPSGLTGDGLPTAIQIIGHRFADNQVLNIGVMLEALIPWTKPLDRIAAGFRP